MVIYLHFLLPAQRYDNFKLISRHVMAKLNMAYLPSLKKTVKKTAVVLIAGVTISGTYSVPPSLHCTIWCRSTFGPRGQGLSNPTSFLRHALPILRPVQRYDNFKLKTSKTAVILIAGVTVSPSQVLRAPALHCTVCCRSTFGPRGQGLSNPTSFLRPALPLAQTTNDNARDK